MIDPAGDSGHDWLQNTSDRASARRAAPAGGAQGQHEVALASRRARECSWCVATQGISTLPRRPSRGSGPGRMEYRSRCRDRLGPRGFAAVGAKSFVIDAGRNPRDPACRLRRVAVGARSTCPVRPGSEAPELCRPPPHSSYITTQDVTTGWPRAWGSVRDSWAERMASGEGRGGSCASPC